MDAMTNVLFCNYPVSTGCLIIGTVVFAAIGTISFYMGKWTL